MENGSDEDQEDPVHRRQFLALSLASTAIGVVGSAPGNALEPADIPMDVDLIRVATLSYRRMDSTTESGRLNEAYG